ncbi:MAG: uroporphyrinogen decarboxylase [Solirubrobacteraceae bacterium]|nr:uroporphyrinogen decarboxylase [Solirubrobacteraceae bacterium]
MVSPSADPLLVRALRREPVERTPVWFMRQAGRSLPEYLEVRKLGSLMEITHRPDLAAEVTLQPVRRHGVDAAILFSDIVTPLEAIGVDVEIKAGIGPVVAQPFRSRADLTRLRDFAPAEDMPALAETIKLITAELGPQGIPLIGFCGAPFTLASYLVEGGPSKQQSLTKAMMLSDPELFRDLLTRLARIAAQSLREQVDAGAEAVQVFDSWIGTLSRAQYRDHILPVMRDLFDELAELGVPRTIFGVGTGHLLDLLAETGADCVGVDWRIDLADARRLVPERCALQGNLDPAVLLAPDEVIEAEVRRIVESAPPVGHIFNLGHGVLPETNAETPGKVVRLVRELTSAKATA